MTLADATGRRPWPAGPRAIVLGSLLAAGIWGWHYLGLRSEDLVPGRGGLDVAMRFFARALSPAWNSEADFVPADTAPLWVSALTAMWTTLRYAAAAVAVSLVLGIVLAIPASTTIWAADSANGSGRFRLARRSVGPILHVASRGLIGFLRSIHELIWAVLFLTAFGRNDLAAVFAIALPYAGVLAKVFSEIVDEAPNDSAIALRATGAGSMQVFAFGALSRALPDMTGYAFYRMECALRTSAVLGFFGFPTLGLFIRQSFSATHYGEVWTYLYALIVLVVAFDAWSGAVRRRLAA